MLDNVLALSYYTHMTLDDAKQIIRDEGFTVLNGGCFEDEQQIYAQSVEADRRCYNHPLCEVQYRKDNGWLSVSGRKPVNLLTEVK